MDLFSRVLKPISSSPKNTKGQGALVAVALVILAGLVVVGLSVSNLGSLNAKRSLAVEYSLETYYCALSGRQEALSTRMVPRSNRLALSGLEASANKPFNKQSGYCYLNPNGATSNNVIGLYRYLIVGGDPARDPSTGNWFDINQQPNNTIKQPFYIISQGAICRDNTTKEAKINTISYNSGTKDVQCGVGQYIDRLTTVTEVDFSRQTGNQDKVNTFQIAQDPSSIALKQPAWVPCQNVTQSVNFNTAYGCGTFPALHHVAFYTPGSSGSTMSLPSPFITKLTVPANGLIRLFFDGPVDYRTFFTATQTSIAQCLTFGQCNVKLLKVGTVQLASTPEPVLDGDIGDLFNDTICTQGPCTIDVPGQGSQTFQTGESISGPLSEGGHQTTGGHHDLYHFGGIHISTGGYYGGTLTSTQVFTPISAQLLPVLGSSTQLVLAPSQPLEAGDYQLNIAHLKDYLGNGFNTLNIAFKVGATTSTPPPSGGTPTCTYPQVWSTCQNKCVPAARCVCAWERYEVFKEANCSYQDPAASAEGGGPTVCPNTMLLQCAQQGSGVILNGGIVTGPAVFIPNTPGYTGSY